jgi:hemoglobin-like flavoprotein
MNSGITARQIELVQSSWHQMPYTLEETATRFYTRLFETDPALKRLFRGDMKDQGRKSMAMLTFIVDSLGRMQEIVPALRSLGSRHAGYGVRDEHYGTVGATLLATLEGGLGPRFTPEVRSAWMAALEALAGTMLAAANVEA